MAEPTHHIDGLLSTLEHDLCDSPLSAMVQVAQDVNDHIVKTLSESGRLDKRRRPSRPSFTSEDSETISPAKVIEEMFETLKPCLFESAAWHGSCLDMSRHV